MLGLAISTLLHDLLQLFSTSPSTTCLTLIYFVVLLRTLHNISSSPKVYLLDFSCYQPPSMLACTKEQVLERFKTYLGYSEETLDYVRKRLERSGLGQSTYLPRTLLAETPYVSMEAAKEETEMVMFGTIDDLLMKTGVEGKDIRIVIVNSSAFIGLPSMCSMIVNRYKLGDDVLSYSLGGMGCSASLIAIGLARNLLKIHKSSYALVYSTENITYNTYTGSDRSKMVMNCVFRVGGAAILLSNRSSDHRTAKYRLVHTVSNTTAFSDRSLNCVLHEEDPQGHVGFTITRDLMPVAAQTIEAHLAALGRKTLPLSEKVKYLTNHAARCLHVANIKPYVPSFRTTYEHVFLHVGGKSVLDGLERQLGFSGEDMEPSRMALRRFGNTSSSSVWYALWYCEVRGKIKSGDRLWSMAYGTGFKCSSVIWKAIRAVEAEESHPWSDEIPALDLQKNKCNKYS